MKTSIEGRDKSEVAEQKKITIYLNVELTDMASISWGETVQDYEGHAEKIHPD